MKSFRPHGRTGLRPDLRTGRARMPDARSGYVVLSATARRQRFGAPSAAKWRSHDSARTEP
ncbi:hypothetical protein EDC90_1007130 [Martelella mediterranea]|uniref:Uncharacterized protein n=1 Tax=Martelella mediterranea TaxID=293089 RepID=A0A4R3P2J1_9HYPH|nr:hypothetical protein EDC90_1007130 [Martelella mediterranea]